MPELPEIETTLRGIAPYLRGQTIRQMVVRERRLRWPVPLTIEKKVKGQQVRFLQRRGKYILVGLDQGGFLIHLGMSGSVRVLPGDAKVAPEAHDHFDIETMTDGTIRYRDPRRFGCLLWHDSDIRLHHRLAELGAEPLEKDFDGNLLMAAARRRKIPVKNLIMNGQIVVGVGNIYASESLFDAGIHPLRRCDRISAERYRLLAESIRRILNRAIEDGGTTLRDFVRSDGSAGYFAQRLMVYDRTGDNCLRCGEVVRRKVVAQRATYYCPGCQH